MTIKRCKRCGKIQDFTSCKCIQCGIRFVNQKSYDRLRETESGYEPAPFCVSIIRSQEDYPISSREAIMQLEVELPDMDLDEVERLADSDDPEIMELANLELYERGMGNERENEYAY